MAAVLIVDEIKSEREELARALEAEGFDVVEAESAPAAVREIWEGTYIVTFIASVLTGKSANQLADEITDMAPEVETIIYSKSDSKAALARKAVDVRDGVAAA